ncbi:MAG: hypothetical protein WCO47_11810 [Methylococcus sp.]|jgi:hypothetical protein
MPPPPEDVLLPQSLMDVFAYSRGDGRVAFLRLLSPITTGPGITFRDGHRFHAEDAARS